MRDGPRRRDRARCDARPDAAATPAPARRDEARQAPDPAAADDAAAAQSADPRTPAAREGGMEGEGGDAAAARETNTGPRGETF